MPNKPEIREIPVRAVIECEICPSCGSDHTRCASTQNDNGLYLNKCQRCEHRWRSKHASGIGVYFFRDDDAQQLLR